MKFTLQDHVRVIKSPSSVFDRTGTVEVIAEGQDHPFGVANLAPWHLWFGPDELTLAEPPQHQSQPSKEKP